MRRPRDSQRAKLYAAERAAFKDASGRRFASADEVAAYVARVTGTQWFRRIFGSCHNFRLIPATGPYSFQQGTTGLGRYTLAIHAKQRVEWVVLHEIAHAVRMSGYRMKPNAPKAWMTKTGAAHGREYAATYLLLVQHYMGADAARRLRAAYRQHRVRYTKPRRLTPAQRAAAAERLAGYRALARGLAMIADTMFAPRAPRAATLPSSAEPNDARP